MIEPSPKKNIILQWISWHYSEALKKIIRAFGNFLVFNFNYFSISILFKTLFSHWRKYRDFYPKGFDFKTYVRVFISNIVSRFLGSIVRIVAIAIGLIFEIFIFAGGAIVLAVWIFFPPILLLVFISGLELLLGI